MAQDVAPTGYIPDSDDMECWTRWKSEVSFAQKDATYVTWLERSKKIIERYRDERNRASLKLRRFNVLWSNIQTLKPVIYSRAPKPIVERRHMDRDPVGRMASTILERTLSFQEEVSKFHDHVSKSVDDLLLTGFGQCWVRYEPSFESTEIEEENEEVEKEDDQTADEVEENGDGQIYEKLAYESLCIDYVFYRDFLWGSARNWSEVPWVARRSWMTKTEVEEQYGEEKARAIVLDYTPPSMMNSAVEDKTVSYFKKAEVWEVWNKADRKVYVFAPGTPGLMLDEKDDPLKLEGFWPCPRPLFATQTSDTIIPVPDYYEYQDQAQELDDLTNRIANLTTAVRANGVYDSSQKNLERLLQEGVDNKLIPVDNWAAFMEGGGSKGAISLVPMQEIMATLISLYDARERVKADMYEINGISDLVRGQGNPNETATAQRIKGQFASNRLQARQEEVARFCCEIIRIMAEIAAEIFSEESLLQMSGMDLIFKDDIRKAGEEVPMPQMPPPPPELQQLPPEAQQQLAQMAQQKLQQQHQMMVQQAQQAKGMELQQQFQEALTVLRSDKLRGFRVDIETDSTIQPDAQAAKEAATELFSSTMQGLTAAGQIVMAQPDLMEPIGELLMYTYRQFRVGRNMESSLEDALANIKENIEKAKEQPPQPTPEMIKAQGEQAKIKAEMEHDQQRFDLEMKKLQAEWEIDRQRAEMDMAKSAEELRIEGERLAMEERKIALEERSMLLKANLDAQSQVLKLNTQRESAQIKTQQQRERPRATGNGAA